MEIRKTIVYIGNRQDESNLFEKATAMADKRSNFLSLESSYWSLSLLKKSQPFWYDFVILDLAKPSPQGIQLLREIKSIHQLQHVPVIVYTDASVLNDLDVINQNGASHYIPKPARTETLIPIFNAMARNEVLPFILIPLVPGYALQNVKQASLA